jgi:Bacterial Ig-like domain (group 2)
MFTDRRVPGLLLLCFTSALVGCSTSGLDSIQVTPATQFLTIGQATQFTAVGTYGNAKQPSAKNITNAVSWTSSTPSVATISATELATAVGAGTTTITAAGRRSMVLPAPARFSQSQGRTRGISFRSPSFQIRLPWEICRTQAIFWRSERSLLLHS